MSDATTRRERQDAVLAELSFAYEKRYGADTYWGGKDLTQYTWSFFAQFGSNLDATPLDSNVTVSGFNCAVGGTH